MVTEIAGKNFQSWAELSFKVREGVTLIDGVNEDDGGCGEAAGKSSILNLLCWVCYGKTPKDINIDDVIRKGQKGCSGSATFGPGLSIHRSRKPNDLYIIRDGEKIRGKDARETQTMITQLLGSSFEAFCNTVYQAQNSQSKFISANQEAKLGILSEIVDLGIYDRARKLTIERAKMAHEASVEHHVRGTSFNSTLELIGKDINFKKAENARVLERHAETGRHLKEQVLKCNIRLENCEKEYLADCKDNERRITVMAQQVARIAVECGVLKDAERQLASEVLASEASAPSLEHIKGLRDKIAEFNAEISQHSYKLRARAESEKLIQNWTSEIDRKKVDLLKTLKFIKNPVEECPTCGTTMQNVNTETAATHADTLKRDIKAFWVKIKEAKVHLDGGIPSVAEVKVSVIATTKNLETAEASVVRLLKGRAEHEASKTKLEYKEQEAEAEHRELTAREAVVVKSTTKIVRAELLELQTDYEKHEAVPPVIDLTEILTMEEELTRLEGCADSAKKSYEKEVHREGVFQSLKVSFRDIKAYVFEGLMDELNSKVNSYLEVLFEVAVSVEFKNELGKIETVITLNGEEMKLGLLSGGQYRRVGLAIDLALSDITTNRKGSRFGGLVILDEYFKDLSENSMEKCLTLLQQRAAPVLIIEHNSVFKSIVDQTFNVRLIDGVSSAVESL